MDTLQSQECVDDARRTDDAAVRVENVTKTFNKGEDAIRAVGGVSFSVEPGSVVGILGPNGAGKTTLIKSLLGLIVPDTGSVRIGGIDVHEQPKAAFHEVDAMLEGARNNYWRLTVQENLRYFATIGGEQPSSIEDRHERLLEAFDLLQKADEPVRNLSRGMKQKVSIASLLARDIQVAFLDEPTLGLDVESSLTLREELRRIADERDITLVLSSHNMDVIRDICDRVIIMQDGRIIADDSVSNLIEAFKTNEYRFTSETIDVSTLETARNRFEVSNVERLAGTTRVTVVLNTEEYYRFNRLLDEHDVELNAVETITPDLEDIFLDITGDDRE